MEWHNLHKGLYTDLKGDLEKHNNELVVVYRETQDTNLFEELDNLLGDLLLDKSSFYPKKTYTTTKTIETGIIKEPFLKCPELYLEWVMKGAEIVVKQRALLNSGFKNLEDVIKLDKGNINIGKDDFRADTRDYALLSIFGRLSIPNLLEFSIHVGDEKVKEFMNKTYPKKGGEVFNYVKTFLQEDNLKAFTTNMNKKKAESIINRLEAYIYKQKFLDSEIKELSKEEDNDNKYFKSMLLKKDLDHTTRSIKKELKKAVELDLQSSKEEYVRDDVKGMKTTINIGELITGLSDRYK